MSTQISRRRAVLERTQQRIQELETINTELLKTLEGLQDGFFGSLQSAAESAPGNPWKNPEHNPCISVPVSIIRDTSEWLAKAIAKGTAR